MLKIIIALTSLLPFAAAWPALMDAQPIMKRADTRLNTGVAHPNPSFNAADQYVDVTPGSAHEFRAPGPGDKRGECPGLNAAANHGFLPRNGKPTLSQSLSILLFSTRPACLTQTLIAITGLSAAYNVSPDLAAVLAAAGVLLGGDIPSLTWSIGGGFLSSLPLILGNPTGILGSHNKYEGDASFTRGDAHLNGGKVNVVQMDKWINIMSMASDGYTMADVAKQSSLNAEYSVQNNAYYFAGPVSGIVAPGAHNLVPALMSNHSADSPGGYLSVDILKSFFAISGSGSSYQYNSGMERIPENWYRRPGGVDQYNTPDIFLDLLYNNQDYPNILKFGGNTGTTNSFTGVDIGNLTGGVFNAQTLLQGDNLACFMLQAAMSVSLADLGGLVGVLGPLLDPVLQPLKSATSTLACPQLKEFHSELFSIFPGYQGV